MNSEKDELINEKIKADIQGDLSYRPSRYDISWKANKRRLKAKEIKSAVKSSLIFLALWLILYVFVKIVL